MFPTNVFIQEVPEINPFMKAVLLWVLLVAIFKCLLVIFFVSVCAVLVGLKDPLPQNTVFAAREP